MPKLSRRNALLDVGRWQRASFEDQERDGRPRSGRRRPDASKRGNADVTLRPADATVSPLDLYLYLKARFGPPNDIMMAARGPGMENLIQWGFALRSDRHLFRIHGTSGRVEFVGEHLSPDEWRALIAALKQDFAKFGPRMSEQRRTLVLWSLFINPFRRVQGTVFGLARRLQSLTLQEPGPGAMAMTKAEADAYDKAFAQWAAGTHLAGVLGTSIRMLAPVVAEAFVNFVLFVLGREDVRRDTRVYDSLLRQQIDVRVRALHVHCDGFARAVGTADKAFEDFQTLMNGRNDFLHGNIDPHRLAFDEMFIDRFGNDQTIPLFRDDRGMMARYLANSLKFVEPGAALNDIDVVMRFVEHVLEHLTDDARERLTTLLGQDYLGRNEETGEIARLFGSTLAEARMIIDDRAPRGRTRRRASARK